MTGEELREMPRSMRADFLREERRLADANAAYDREVERKMIEEEERRVAILRAKYGPSVLLCESCGTSVESITRKCPKCCCVPATGRSFDLSDE